MPEIRMANTVLHPHRRAVPSHTVPGIQGPYEIGSSLTVANTPVAPGCDKLAPQTTKPFGLLLLSFRGIVVSQLPMVFAY